MSAQALMETARALVAGDKGLLAMDESNPTCDRRFARRGFPRPSRRGTPIGIDPDHGRSGRLHQWRDPGRSARSPQGLFSNGRALTKWRAVITMGEGLPSWGCIEANAHALARYAVLCQEVGLVPIVEPEVLMDGDQSLEQRRAATEEGVAKGFCPALRARRDGGRDDPQPQYGTFGVELCNAGERG